MPDSISIKPILPKRRLNPQAVEAMLQQWLKDFSFGVIADMQKYPPAQPWKNPPPKTGPRAGGRRTGNYGRNWVPIFSQRDVRIVNRIAYAVYVGGATNRSPGQTSVMAQRGWPSITDVAAKWRKAKLPKFSRVVWTG